MSVTTLPVDYTTIKQRQQAVWSAGDYAMIGTTLQIVGKRRLCEAVDMHAGSSVLDVAAKIELPCRDRTCSRVRHYCRHRRNCRRLNGKLLGHLGAQHSAAYSTIII